MLTVGANIIRCRLQKGITQAELAARCGIHQPNLSNIEKEKQNVVEYTNQLKTEFPYKEELTTRKNRLVEVDSIIIAKAKEVAENKKVMQGLQNEGEEDKQTPCQKRNS